MRILLTNDDGFDAPGLQSLIQGLAPLGALLVVAPESERSATAHGICVHRPCRLMRRQLPVAGSEAFSLDANPADCVKWAFSSHCVGDLPDLVVSGINRGQNAGHNVIYSGTVAAALEAAMHGVPSMAISLAARREEEADFEVAAAFARHLAPQILEAKIPPGVMLNVNVPNLPRERIRGVAWTRQGHARFTDRFEALPRDNPPDKAANGTQILRNIGDAMVISDPLTYLMTHEGLWRDPPTLDLSL
jgi:5'-nucleotidase